MVVAALGLWLAACTGGGDGDDSPLDGPPPAGKADDASDSASDRVGSREYKVRLETEPFEDLEDAVEDLSREVEDAIELEGLELDRDRRVDLDKERTVRFLDIAGSCPLRTSGFIVRDRADDGGHDRQITLKRRDEDLFAVALTDLDPREDARQKFEEDYTPPDRLVFSKSASIDLDEDEEIETTDDLHDLFGSLVGVLPEDEEMTLVGDVVIDERKYLLGEVDLGDLDAELSVTLWWLPDSDIGDDPPDMAELSFAFEREDEFFPAADLITALQLFSIIQNVSIVTEPGTKTGAIYGLVPLFCE